jgi:hypothetical protein
MEEGGPTTEIIRILESLATYLKRDLSNIDYGNLRDANGNTVGNYEYTE